MRGKVMPFARISIVVGWQSSVALNSAASEKSEALASHTLIPFASGKKKKRSFPPRSPPSSKTKAGSVTETPSPPRQSAGAEGNFRSPTAAHAVSTKKTISEPCSRRMAANRSGVLSMGCKKRYGAIRPGGVQPQPMRKHHADQHAGQRQPQVLQANGFVMRGKQGARGSPSRWMGKVSPPSS